MDLLKVRDFVEPQFETSSYVTDAIPGPAMAADLLKHYPSGASFLNTTHGTPLILPTSRC